ncbi:hypothetical protein C8T65DRAFT_597643 [Cerioporus squamosus]|nr:hypothetical protein C8T65DRAFT_597643 [Cerioporus squamosus]
MEEDLDPRLTGPHQDHPEHDDVHSDRPGSVHPPATSDHDSDDEEPPRRRPRLESEEPGSDDSGNLAEPELNGELVGRKAPLRGDYVQAVKEVLDRAVTLYKTLLTCEDAYPDTLTARTWAKTAWKQATVELDIPLKYHSSIIPLITRYSWHLRSELKGAARSTVEGMYGFKPVSATDLEWVQYNKERASALLTNKAFAYEVRHQPHDAATDKGLYQVGIIQSIINRVYYKGPKDDGVVHDDVYRPFPLKGLALVLTAIECAIQEWETGVYSNVNFNQQAYSTVYAKHVKDLENFEYKGQQRSNDVLAKIRTKLSERGRSHAKAPIEQYTSSGEISEEQLDRALEAYLHNEQ